MTKKISHNQIQSKSHSRCTFPLLCYLPVWQGSQDKERRGPLEVARDEQPVVVGVVVWLDEVCVPGVAPENLQHQVFPCLRRIFFSRVVGKNKTFDLVLFVCFCEEPEPEAKQEAKEAQQEEELPTRASSLERQAERA